MNFTPIRMPTSRTLVKIDLINDLLKTLPTSIKISKNSQPLVPKEMVRRLKRGALEKTLPFLNGIITKIRAEQEKYGEVKFDDVKNRKKFVLQQIKHLKCCMERDFDSNRNNQVKSLLSEIEYYEQMNIKPGCEINIGEQATAKIFKLLSDKDIKPTDSHIWEYLSGRINFLCHVPSDIEISALKAMLGLLQGNNITLTQKD